MSPVKLRQGSNGLQVATAATMTKGCGCLPEFPPEPCPVPLIPNPCLSVPQCSNMLGWAVWLSEVMVGIDSPNEDIAANYVRQTAITFADEAKVLRRHITFQPPFCDQAYKLPCQEGERVGGVIKALLKGCCGERSVPVRESCDGIRFVNADCACIHLDGPIEVEYYVVPTEDALRFDEILYRKYRRPIAEAARADYVRATHFRDYKLLRSVQAKEVFEQDIAKARHGATEFSQRTPHRSAL